MLDGNEVGWSRRKSTTEKRLKTPWIFTVLSLFSFLLPKHHQKQINTFIGGGRMWFSPLSHIASLPLLWVCLPPPLCSFLPTFDLNSSRSLTIAWRDLPCAFSGMEFDFPYLSPVGPCVFSLLPLPADACWGQQETRGPCKCLMIIAEQRLLWKSKFLPDISSLKLPLTQLLLVIFKQGLSPFLFFSFLIMGWQKVSLTLS